MKRLGILLAALLLLCPVMASAGDLKNFEDELSKPAPPSTPSSPKHDHDHHDDDDAESLLVQLLGYIIIEVLSDASQATYNYSLEREPGSPTIPYVRVENYFQTLLDSDVNGYAVRGEAGWAMLGVGFEWMRYWEDTPPDQLDSWYVEGLFRLAGNENFRFDIAVGGRSFERIGFHGGVQTGFSVGAYGYRAVGVEGDFRWAVVNDRTLSDIRGGLVGRLPNFQYVSLRAGYRLMAIGNQKLHGPEFNLAVTW